MARCHEGGVEIGHELVPAYAGKDEPKGRRVVLEPFRTWPPFDFRNLNSYLVCRFCPQHLILNSRLHIDFGRLEGAIVSLSPVNASPMRW